MALIDWEHVLLDLTALGRAETHPLQASSAYSVVGSDMLSEDSALLTTSNPRHVAKCTILRQAAVEAQPRARSQTRQNESPAQRGRLCGHRGDQR